ncbi:Acyltransferase [Nesidiocoris tenuis]|uniref:1-acylglycerol-3-phosphate O-acyltransferase n=1 Tax=Nesidiocoris tenuis TaxID=355587 RepID=A0ABN7ANB4_9HEMI|nr:Acyltransferase [Nesidiocoris tenuis]
MNILCSVILVPVLMAFFFVPNIVSKYIWFCSAIFCRIAGLDIQIRDYHFMRDKGKGIIIINHMSALDSLVGCYNARNFGDWILVVKKELKWYGPYGLALRITNAIFIDRSNSKAAMRQLSEAARQIFSQSKTKHRIVFYPEGTRNSSPDGKLLPFKLGAFRLAAENGVPIFPVVTSRYYFCRHFRKFERGSIVCKVLPPLYIEPGADLDDVARRTRLLMQNELDELSEEVKRSSAEQSSGFWIGVLLAIAALLIIYLLFQQPDNRNHSMEDSTEKLLCS